MWEWFKREWLLGSEEARTSPEQVASKEEALRPGYTEIDVVFHGPGLAGKTTNIQWIYQRTAPDARSRLASIATDTDRWLFCRIYPKTVAHPSGAPLSVRLSAVPGPVFYDESRVRLLRGAHGIVFVAESQEERHEANLESLEGLHNALEANGVDPTTFPLVFQYNKRDLPGVMSVEQMNADLNPRGVPHFAAVAVRGVEVFPTLKACVRLILERARTDAAK